MERIEQVRCFGGWQQRYRHRSQVLDCDMVFSVYLPPQAQQGAVPVLYWLSGLTCSDQNFVTKAGAQRYAAEHGIAIVAPDTSPRGDDVANDEAYDLGQGAGFYVNATEAPWSRHYRMYDYVLDELPMQLRGLPLDTGRGSIAGHSMGGHGALVLGLRNPRRYAAISAFAPISAPMRCSWGEKAFTAYLGSDRQRWEDYDATVLLRSLGCSRPIRVDQGLADTFLTEQLQPEQLEAAAAEAQAPLELHRHADYDHSYYFIASFIGAHIAFHAAQLRRA